MTARVFISTHLSARRKIRQKKILQVARDATYKGRQQQISRNHPAKQETEATEKKWIIERRWRNSWQKRSEGA